MDVTLEPRGSAPVVKTRVFERAVRERHMAIISLANGGEIRGTVHLIPGTRMTDLLERGNEQFIAVTEATIVDARGRTKQVPYVAVNKSQVVTVEDLGREIAAASAMVERSPEAAEPKVESNGKRKRPERRAVNALE